MQAGFVTVFVLAAWLRLDKVAFYFFKNQFLVCYCYFFLACSVLLCCCCGLWQGSEAFTLL